MFIFVFLLTIIIVDKTFAAIDCKMFNDGNDLGSRNAEDCW